MFLKKLLLIFMIFVNYFCCCLTAQGNNNFIFYNQELVIKGAQNVFQIRATNNDSSVTYGSAVFLKFEGDFAYLATCYHNIYNTKSFELAFSDVKILTDNIIQWKKNEKIISSQNKNFEVFLQIDNDVVIIRTARKNIEETWKDYKPSDILKEESSTYKTQTQGLVFGYPSYDTLNLYPITVRIGETAGIISAFKGMNWRKGTAPDKNLKFRFLSENPTAKGMSGGLVLDHKGNFSGLVFGRFPDTVSLAISEENVMKIFSLALENQGNFKKYDVSILKIEPILKEALETQSAKENIFANIVKWKHFESWQEAFKDPTSFRENFQEISIDLQPFLDTESKNTFALYVTNSEKDDSDTIEKKMLDIWFNSNEYIYCYKEKKFKEKEEKDYKNGKEKLELFEQLVPGENLLILSVRNNNKGFEINDLFRTLDLDVNFLLNEKVFYNLHRSLPNVVDGYSVFVSIYKEPLLPQNIRFNARLAVRKDFLTKFINKRYFEFELDSSDQNFGSFQGTAFLKPQEQKDLKEKELATFQTYLQNNHFQNHEKNFATFHFKGPQTIEICNQVGLKVHKLNIFGINFEDKTKQDYIFPIFLKSKLQLLYLNQKDSTEFRNYFPRRLISTYTSKETNIPIFEKGNFALNFDFTNLFQEVFLNWINNTILKINNPTVINNQELKSLSEKIGIHFKPKLLYCYIDKEHEWLIWLFDFKDERGKAIESEGNISLVPENRNSLLSFQFDFENPKDSSPFLKQKILSKLSESVFDKEGIEFSEGGIEISEYTEKNSSESTKLKLENYQDVLNQFTKEILSKNLDDLVKNTRKTLFLNIQKFEISQEWLQNFSQNGLSLEGVEFLGRISATFNGEKLEKIILLPESEKKAKDKPTVLNGDKVNYKNISITGVEVFLNHLEYYYDKSQESKFGGEIRFRNMSDQGKTKIENFSCQIHQGVINNDGDLKVQFTNEQLSAKIFFNQDINILLREATLSGLFSLKRDGKIECDLKCILPENQGELKIFSSIGGDISIQVNLRNFDLRNLHLGGEVKKVFQKLKIGNQGEIFLDSLFIHNDLIQGKARIKAAHSWGEIKLPCIHLTKEHPHHGKQRIFGEEIEIPCVHFNPIHQGGDSVGEAKVQKIFDSNFHYNIDSKQIGGYLDFGIIPLSVSIGGKKFGEDFNIRVDIDELKKLFENFVDR